MRKINKDVSFHYRQRLVIIKHYFIAQHENILSKERQAHSKRSPNINLERQRRESSQQKSIRSKSNSSTITQNRALVGDQDPTRGLARLGSRAALSFAFKFLKRAWRSGEDVDLCSDILYESLDALQVSSKKNSTKVFFRFN